MLHITIHALNGNAIQCIRNAKVPIRITSTSSFLKIVMIGSAKTNPATATTIKNTKADVEIIKIDESMENRQKAIDYQIMAVPTIVIDGDVAFVGAPTDFELIEKLES